MRALAFLVLLAGCVDSGAPDLLNLRCTQTVHATGAGPFVVSCDTDFDGKPGDVHWFARSADGTLWTSGFDSLDSAMRSAGTYHFTMSKASAPPLGTLTITLSAEHVDGIDGPAGDEIETQVEVVP